MFFRLSAADIPRLTHFSDEELVDAHLERKRPPTRLAHLLLMVRFF